MGLQLLGTSTAPIEATLTALDAEPKILIDTDGVPYVETGA